MKTLLWIAVAALVGAYICIPLGDPDLWWHITVGRWIIAHGAVPTIDHWNTFAVGTPWRAYSWSNEVIYALVERRFGERGLAALQLMLAMTLAGAFQYLLGRLARDYFVGALLGVFATLACFAHFSLRPQTLVWILFLAALVVADQYQRKSRTGALVLMAAIGAAWANTHLSAILGVAGVSLWVLGSGGVSGWGRTGVVAGAFLLGTFCTPYGGGEWLTFLEKSGHALQFHSIDEFKPAHILQFPTAFVLLLVFLLVTVCVTGRRWPAPGRLVLAGGMVLAGMTAVKFIPFAVVALSAVIAAWWRDLKEVPASDQSHLVVGVKVLNLRLNSLHPQTVGALAFFYACVAIACAARYMEVVAFAAVTPKRAVDFIESKSLSHPVLNDFGSGGYLMYRFSGPDGEPRHTVSIDGRTNVNPSALWRSFENAHFGRSGWREYIDTVKPKTILWRQGGPFTELLLESPEWCRVFQTGTAAHDYSVFISKGEFESRGDELSSPDCVHNQ